MHTCMHVYACMHASVVCIHVCMVCIVCMVYMITIVGMVYMITIVCTAWCGRYGMAYMHACTYVGMW